MVAEFRNTLFYGDNLAVFREHLADESIDLIYLDPPFKSNQDYNVLFKEQSGERAAAQIKAFEDTWRWDEAASLTYQETVEAGGRARHQVRMPSCGAGGHFDVCGGASGRSRFYRRCR